MSGNILTPEERDALLAVMRGRKVEALKVRRANAPVAALRESPPRDTNGVRDIIMLRFGVGYTRGGAVRLMHRPGFGYIRPKGLSL